MSSVAFQIVELTQNKYMLVSSPAVFQTQVAMPVQLSLGYFARVPGENEITQVRPRR